MFGDDRYHEIMQLYENMQLDGFRRNAPHRDAVRSYLESIRGPIECPIEFVMAKLDEVKTNIPEQKYIEMSTCAHASTRRKEANETQSIISRQLIVRGGVIGLVLESANVFQCCQW